MDDELARRIRSLEAERLRPVPPPPAFVPRSHPRPVDELDARRSRRKSAPADKDAGIRALRAAGELYRAKQAQLGERED